MTQPYNFSKAETFGVCHKVKLQLLPDMGLEEEKKKSRAMNAGVF